MTDSQIDKILATTRRDQDSEKSGANALMARIENAGTLRELFKVAGDAPSDKTLKMGETKVIRAFVEALAVKTGELAVSRPEAKKEEVLTTFLEGTTGTKIFDRAGYEIKRALSR